MYFTGYKNRCIQHNTIPSCRRTGYFVLEIIEHNRILKFIDNYRLFFYSWELSSVVFCNLLTASSNKVSLEISLSTTSTFATVKWKIFVTDCVDVSE